MLKTTLSLVIIALCGCSGHSVPYNEDDVRKFVRAGMAREAIIERFGEPEYDEKNPRFEDGSTKVDEIIYYSLPLNALRRTQQQPREERFTGFQVHLKDGKVLDWLPSR